MALILLIDDDHDMRSTLRRILTNAGHTVVEAGNGSDGLRRVAEDRPALVITDILMPGMDGIETIQCLTGAHPGLRVIAMTGGGRYHGFEYLDVARALGAHALLNKPFRAETLLETVRGLLPPSPRA